MDIPQKFIDCLNGFSDEIRAMTLAAREVIVREMPDMQEVAFDESLNYSPDGKYRHRVCYLWPGKNHVTLGFFFGTDLDDPKGLLEGVGKRMRHVKLKSLEEASSEAVRYLVRQASTLASDYVSSQDRKATER